MSFKDLFKGLAGMAAAGAANDPAEIARQNARSYEWQNALQRNAVPGFVSERLRHTAVGRLPWISTASPADLLTLRTHGIRTLGMVAGNCWFHFGYSWTEGHRDGWRTAIARMQHEAGLMGADAVVEVRLNTRRLDDGGQRDSMDYSAVGVAVTVAGFEKVHAPVIATVSQLEFARLMEVGVLPVGLAVGACYEWMADPYGWADVQQGYFNQELEVLAGFQSRVRRSALSAMTDDAHRQQGSGVLGRVQFTEMFREQGGQDGPTQYLCRHIAFGTVVQHRRHDHVSAKPRAVLLTRMSKSKSLEASESVI